MQEVDQILAKYSGASSRLPPRKSSVQGEVPARSLQVADVKGVSSRKLDVRNYQEQPNPQNVQKQQENQVDASLTIRDMGVAPGKDQPLLRDVLERSAAVPIQFGGQSIEVRQSVNQRPLTPGKQFGIQPQTPLKQQKAEQNNNNKENIQCKQCGFANNFQYYNFCGLCGTSLNGQQKQNVGQQQNQQQQIIQQEQVELWDAVGELRGQVRSLHLELLKVADDQRKWAGNITETLQDVKQMLQRNPGSF